MPGVDPLESVRMVVGELPLLPFLPELPARQVGADLIGRTAAMLVDLPVEVVPSGYRVTAHAGRDVRRGMDLLARDLDALQDVLDATNNRPDAGQGAARRPVDAGRRHRTDARASGADRSRRAARVHRRRWPRAWPGTLPRWPRGPARGCWCSWTSRAWPLSWPVRCAPRPAWARCPPVPEPDARDVLAVVIDAAKAATGQPVVVHSCADRPPIAVFGEAGADAVSFDVTLLDRGPAALLDEVGQAWDSGVTLFLGLVPSIDPPAPVTPYDLARPALRMTDQLGMPRSWLADRAVPTPTCGLAGASTTWARRALALTSELGGAFQQPPEAWSAEQP